MKKFLMLSAALFLYSVAPVAAQDAVAPAEAPAAETPAAEAPASRGGLDAEAIHKIREGRLDKMFAKDDADGDGKISKSEFLAAHEKRFAEIDTDGDAAITKEEFGAKMKAMHEKMKEHRAKRMEQGGRETPAPTPAAPEKAE